MLAVLSLGVTRRHMVNDDVQLVRSSAAARCAPLRRAPAYCSGVNPAEDYPFYGLDAWSDHLDGLARIEMEANYSTDPSLDPSPSAECVAAMKAVTCARFFAPCAAIEEEDGGRRPLRSPCVCALLCQVLQALACPLAESLECSTSTSGSSSHGSGSGDALCFSDDAACSGYDLSAHEIGVEGVIEQAEPQQAEPQRAVRQKADDDSEGQDGSSQGASSARAVVAEANAAAAPAAERLTMAEEDARALEQARAATAPAPNGIRIIVPKPPGVEMKRRASTATTSGGSGAAAGVVLAPPFVMSSVAAAALAGARAAVGDQA